MLCNARATLSRPWDAMGVVLELENCDRGSTLFIKIDFVWATVRYGLYEHNNATAPATCGEAIEVPLKKPYVVVAVRVVLRMLTPGAAMSTLFAPKLEKLA